MAKLNINRLSLAIVMGLVFVAVSNIAENVYSAIGSTGEEQAQLNEKQFRDLGSCKAPTEEELIGSIEERQASHRETVICHSETSIAAAKKSKNEMVSEARASGDVKTPEEKDAMPGASSCSKTDKKIIAEQARYGAKTDGLIQGQKGAETMASMPGSTAESALTSLNLRVCHENTLRAMAEPGPSLKRYCADNPDLCTQSTQSWYSPVTVVKASVSRVGASLALANDQALVEKLITQNREVEERARQERAAAEKYNYLSAVFKVMADKEKEINAKAQIQMMAFMNAVKKFDQGGTAHNASSL